MVIYNVTAKVDHSIVTAWLKWMKEEYIPDNLATRCFTDATILHLFESDDEEGVTYAIQFHSSSQESYNYYIENFSNAMQKKSIDKWGNKFITFSTAMKVVR